MTFFWILPIIVFLVYMYNKTFRQTINSFFQGKKSKSSSSKSSSSKKRTYDDNYFDGYYDYRKTNNSDNFYRETKYDDYRYFIDKIYDDMKNDFLKANYADKFVFDNTNIIGYMFENGRLVKINNDGYLFDGLGKKVKINYEDITNFMTYYKGLAEMAKRRPTDSSFGGREKYYKSNDYSSSSHYTTNNPSKYTKEQLYYQEKFWKLKKINDLRMKQLNGMNEKDPKRSALVNEVNVVKRKMKKFYDKSGLTIKK